MPKIYFASNRDVKRESSPTGNLFGNRFNAAGPQFFRVGHSEATLTGNPLKDNAWKVGPAELYDENVDADKADEIRIGSKAMFEEMRQHLRQEAVDVIIFLHGFANDFQNTMRRAAALEHLYGDEGRKAIVMAFSWPSNGKSFPRYEYFSDREDAEMSGLAMARALKRLVEFLQSLREADAHALREARRAGEVADVESLQQCARRLHLVAHSMGNWALRFALLKFIQLNEGRVPRVLDKVFLMAADEDHDALEKDFKLHALARLANQIFVYHARNDVALEISDRTKGNASRLGSDGPENLDFVSERAIAIDCQDVSATIREHGRHQYYRLRKEVIEDVTKTLADEPQEDRPGRRVIRPGRSWRLRPQA